MTAERLEKGSDGDRETHALARQKTSKANDRQTTGASEPLYLASKRLRKKLKVRRTAKAIGRQRYRA